MGGGLLFRGCLRRCGACLGAVSGVSGMVVVMAGQGKGRKREKPSGPSWGLSEDLEAVAGSGGRVDQSDAAAGKSGAGRMVDPRAVLKTLKQLAKIRDTDVLPAGRERVELWRQVLARVSEQSRVGKSGLGQWSLFRQRQSVRLREFDPGCAAVGQVGEQGDTFVCGLLFEWRSGQTLTLCSCGSERVCPHLGCLADSLDYQLKTAGSEFEVAVYGQTVSQRERKRFLEHLRTLAQKSRESAPVETPESFSAVEKPRVRYGWNLTVSLSDGERLPELRPVLYVQQGKRWVAEKELLLETFQGQPSEQLSELDRRLQQMFPLSSWRNPRTVLRPALELLAGTGQLELNRQSAELERLKPELWVESVSGGLRLTTSLSRFLGESADEGGIRTYEVEGGLLGMNLQRLRVAVLRLEGTWPGLFRRVGAAGVVFGEGEQDVLWDVVHEAQKWMEVHLPEGGEERAVRLQPALLLQMREEGVLDSTLCMADSGGNLHYPGSGSRRVLLTTGGDGAGLRDDSGSSLVRDLEWEDREARRLSGELGLSGGRVLREWVWRHVEGGEVQRIVQASAALHGEGVLRVLWHRQSTVRMDLLGRMTAQNVQVRVQRKRDWFGLDGVVQFGGRELSLREVLPGLSNEPVNGLIEVLPGQWAQVEDEILRMLRRLHDVALESRGGLQLDPSAALVVAELESASIAVTMDRQWQKCLQRLRDSRELDAELPVEFRGELRDYQLQGYRWLSRLAAWGIGCVLADDMGLGKTVQTLALLVARASAGPSLIIAPTSLGFNWQRECERFAPGLRPVLYRESERDSVVEGVGAGDVVICSYGLALRDVERLQRREWHTLVLDEAQNVKNSNSKTAVAVRQLRADWRVALTGTPMENHLGELWSIFHVVAPGVLGSWEQFRQRFAQPIEREGSSERRGALARVIAPFLLRRAKRDVLLELPERTEVNLLVELSAAERERYEQARRSAMATLDQLSEGAGEGSGNDVGRVGGAGAAGLGNEQRLQVLALLLRLRQLACHVKLVDGGWSQGSSKLQLLREKLLELKERGHRALVFSQFTSHLELIRRECEDAGVTYQYLDGSTPAGRRQELVESFQGGVGDVFLISLKAGGTGLNLTAADYVIHMDPWWNPAVEDQATDRAHRMGQERPVVVYRLISRETVEEQILSLHEEKRDLVDGVLSGTDAASRLSTQDLAKLIRSGGE